MRTPFFSVVLLNLIVAVVGGVRAATPPAEIRADGPTIVCFGDSITAGYGLAEPAAEAYPALLQKKIEAARLRGRVVGAGVSGETSSGGVRRVEWVLRQPIDIFVLALGANDGLRGIEPAITRANLQRIIDRVREKSPTTKIVLAGMIMGPNLGPDYTRDFAAIYPALAEKNRITLVPFLLDGVAGRAELNQSDGIHPTAEGHAIVAENIWKVLRPLL